MRLRSFLAAAALLSSGLAAHAAFLTGSYAVTVHEGTGPSGGFDTAAGNPYPSGISATFTYTGALDFNNTAAQNSGSSGDLNSTFFGSAFSTPPANDGISNYSGSGTIPGGIANFNNLGQFLSSSGSASNYAYGSYYTFDLGILGAGTILTITHDDGISVFQGATRVGTSVSGPTSQTTDIIDVTNTGDTVLRYARENGTPSILEVSASTAVAPEPSSLTLLGTGLLGVAGVVRKRFKQ